MPEFRISNRLSQQYVTLPASFITEYMPSMKGDYLKLYLYLVYLTQNREVFSLPALADLFECSERDLLRGLSYLQRSSLIEMETDEKGEPCSLTLLPAWEKDSAPAADQDESAQVSTSRSASRTARSENKSGQTGSKQIGSETEELSAESASGAASAGAKASGSRFSQKLPEISSGSAAEPSSADPVKASLEESHTPVLPYESHVTQGLNGWGTVASVSRGEQTSPEAIRSMITGHSGSTSPLKVTPAPVPEPEELPHLLQDPRDPKEADLVVNVIEEYIGRPMTRREEEKTRDYYMMLGQNFDLTICLFEYYIDLKGRENISFNYLDKIAKEWKTKGYKSDQEPRELLAKRKKDSARREYELTIQRHLGIREILPVHVPYVDRWRDEYKIPQEVLVIALDEAAKNGHSSLDYADAILKQWSEKKIWTEAEALQALEDFRNKGKAQRQAHKEQQDAPRPRKTTMHNFTERKESPESYNDLLRIRFSEDPEGSESEE